MPIGKYIYCTTAKLLKERVAKSQMPIGKYIYCTLRNANLRFAVLGHKCLSASTFTVRKCTPGRQAYSPVTNAYRQVHLLYPLIIDAERSSTHVTNAYRQVHLLYLYIFRRPLGDGLSQMPIGKYIYCTGLDYINAQKEAVTNAYRQVHLLYVLIPMAKSTRSKSQMPIGKYIYCTTIFKLFPRNSSSHKCLSASTFTILYW